MSNKAVEIEIPVVMPQKYRFLNLKRRPGGVGRRSKSNRAKRFKKFRQSRRHNQLVTTTAKPIAISTQLTITLMPPIQLPILPVSADPISVLPLAPPISALPPVPALDPQPVSLFQITPPPAVYEELQLKNVEDEVEKLLLRLNKNLDIVKDLRQYESNSNYKNMSHIYKEDVEQALKDLEERLLNHGAAGEAGPRPATLYDLTRAIDQLERNILEHRDILATSTPEPCGEEMLLVEALKPVRKEDFDTYMNNIQNNCNNEKRTDHVDKTRRQYLMNFVNPKLHDNTMAVGMEYRNKNDPTFGEKLLGMLREKLDMTTPNGPSATSSNIRRSYGEEILDVLRNNVPLQEEIVPAVATYDGNSQIIPIKIEIPEYN